jgi:5-methylthioadenosine/S-adenosylhomocysteine deaminase
MIFIVSVLLQVMDELLEKVDVLIRGCIVLPMNRPAFIRDGALAIKNGKLVFVGKSSAVANTAVGLEIDANGKVALPGLINCHTPVPMTLYSRTCLCV